jgi:hypothetical protein
MFVDFGRLTRRGSFPDRGPRMAMRILPAVTWLGLFDDEDGVEPSAWGVIPVVQCPNQSQAGGAP